MPYHVAKTSKCPSSKPWGVIKDSTGEALYCHPTKAKAEAQMAALYANEPKGQESMTENASDVNGRGSRADIKTARREQRERGEMPGGKLRTKSFPGKLTARLVDRGGKQFYHLDGFATVFERGYPMWDMFGEYKEIVDYGALDKSLANKPDVAWLVNHRGVTMARTTNGTLELDVRAMDDGYRGFHSDAYLNPDRQDVRDIVSAVVDELVDEMSFAFMLNDGAWNDDYTEFRIMEADINRGDVSAVNYGANPFTSIQARTAEILADIERLPASALSRAQQIVAKRIFRSAATDLSQRSAERYQRAAESLERIAHDAGLDDFDLSDIADWEIEDETGEDDEPETPEERSANKSDLVHIPGGKSLSLWTSRLENLKNS